MHPRLCWQQLLLYNQCTTKSLSSTGLSVVLTVVDGWSGLVDRVVVVTMGHCSTARQAQRPLS
jgi:hypothetical protein